MNSHVLEHRYGGRDLPVRDLPSPGLPRGDGPEQGDAVPDLPAPGQRTLGHDGTGRRTPDQFISTQPIWFPVNGKIPIALIPPGNTQYKSKEKIHLIPYHSHDRTAAATHECRHRAEAPEVTPTSSRQNTTTQPTALPRRTSTARSTDSTEHPTTTTDHEAR